MTDMRATERLLEDIDHAVEELEAYIGEDPTMVVTIALIDATMTELRRRGDTLVRAEDLRLVLECDITFDEPGSVEAVDRLENALGGKLA